MKFGEYILEELSFHKWKLKSGFEFKKNKVVKVKVKKFSPEETSFLFSLAMAFGLNFKEKDSIEILKFFVDKKIIKPNGLSNFISSSKARKNAWKK